MWYWFVLGTLTEELVFQITNGGVPDYADTVKEHALALGHSLLAAAVNADVGAKAQIGPVVKTARAAFAGPVALRRALDCAPTRPVHDSARGVLRAGKASLRCAAPKAALAYWELGHPVDDMVARCLPTVAPDVSTTNKMYEFIGSTINNGTITARAQRLAAAAALLTQ